MISWKNIHPWTQISYLQPKIAIVYCGCRSQHSWWQALSLLLLLAINGQNWFRSCHQEYKPLFYLRYVDDTLLFFASKEHIDPFLAFLNNQPTPISFTKEEENDGHIAFLDLNIYRHESPLTTFSTSIFRKKTFTVLLTKYDSFIPHIFKLNLISSLIYRAWHLSSSYLNLHIELTYIYWRTPFHSLSSMEISIH